MIRRFLGRSKAAELSALALRHDHFTCQIGRNYHGEVDRLYWQIAIQTLFTRHPLAPSAARKGVDGGGSGSG